MAMLRRRTVLAGMASAIALPAIAKTPSWKSSYPELVYAVVPAENSSSLIGAYTPFVDYLTDAIGTKVALRVGSDYASVIEGQRSGNIHVAYYGPASFARARRTGVNTDAFVIDVGKDGSKGYYSVFYVLADSPYKSIEDLKGKNIGLVDPNSTSGYNMPLYTLDKMGISDARSYFSNILIAGSHENALIALAGKTVDACANWWNNENDSELLLMSSKGMLQNADGTRMKRENFRIILTSPLIINPLTAMLSNLPPDLKDAIRNAFLNAATADKVAFDRISEGRKLPWQPVDNAAYDDTIKMVAFVDRLHRKAN